MNKLTIEKQLLNASISNSNNNIALSPFEHTRNIENILEEIFISEDSFIVDSDQFYNNTIIALIVANLADEVLRNYGHAFGIPSNIMQSMNFSNIVSSHSMNNGNTISTNMVDNSSHQSALKTSDRMIEIYDTGLNSSSNSDFINNAKSDLSGALYDLERI
jgi:hypothetical protein